MFFLLLGLFHVIFSLPFAMMKSWISYCLE